jgi:hypothetical protein
MKTKSNIKDMEYLGESNGLVLSGFSKKSGRKPKIKVYELPKNSDALEKFILKNKKNMLDHVLSCLEYAYKKNLDFVEVFKFKNTTFIVTVQKEEYVENINHLYSEYINLELYEECKKILEFKNKYNV